MAYDAQGTLHEIFEEQQVSEKFKKREFVLEIPDGSYTQFIKFQLTNDKCNLLDHFKQGDGVKVAFNLSGKPFTKNGTTMYFTNLAAWRVEPAEIKTQMPVAAPATGDEADNDLPF